jgi:hypothetical protein
MSPDVTAEISDSVGTVIEKCLATQNWDVSETYISISITELLMQYFQRLPGSMQAIKSGDG